MINMATSTYNASLADRNDAGQSKPGLFTKLLKGFVEMQTTRARVLTADFLSGVSDEHLASYGWTKQDIKRLRNL